MLYRRLDAAGDYCFGKSKSDFLDENEAVAQAIKTRLYLLYGEWWEDIEDGLPLWQKIIGSSGSEQNRSAVDIIVRGRILGTIDVVTLPAFESRITDRKYDFACMVTTAYGDLYLTSGG